MNVRETRITILAGVLLALVVGLAARGETSSQAPDSASADVAVKIPEWTAPEAAVRILTAPIHKKRHTLWLEFPGQLQVVN